MKTHDKVTHHVGRPPTSEAGSKGVPPKEPKGSPTDLSHSLKGTKQG